MATGNYTPPAAALIKSTRTDFDLRGVVQPVHLVQYDDTLPVLAVALYKNGQPWAVPSGAAVNIRMDKGDGHFVYNPALGVTSDRRTVYAAVTAQMTAVHGVHPAVLEVRGSGVACTGALRLEIDRNPVQAGAIESTDEYKTVQELADEVAANAKVVRDNQAAIKAVSDNLAAIKAAPAKATAAANSAAAAEKYAKEAQQATRHLCLYKGTYLLDQWTAGSDGTYTQTAAVTAVDGGPALTADMNLSEPHAAKTASDATNQTLLRALALLNRGPCTAGAGTVTCTAAKKPPCDITVYWYAR